MRLAIVHYWLLGMRGGEFVVEALCRLFPDADIFTLFYDPDLVSGTIRNHRVTASYLNPFRRHHRRMLPFMPSALESFDLRGYDLVISSESGPAKGVLTSARTKHLCYCHTPMRYLWELYPAYLHDWTSQAWKRAFMRPLSRRLRLWDFAAAARVDEFVANSANVQQRIWKTYRRESQVIHPPVAVNTFRSEPADDYYMTVSELVSYKQLDYAIAAFAQNGRRLRIVGDGPEYRALRRLASPNIEFCGRVSPEELRSLYARCRAFVQPGEEDFGIASVEALASGRPVIALGRGGAVETVPLDPLGGVLYPESTVSSLQGAIQELDRIENSVRPLHLQRWASQFDETQFRLRMEEKIHQIMTPASVPAGLPAWS
ncbi:MAG: glycosyltransferase [Acidobacteriota bacterium]